MLSVLVFLPVSAFGDVLFIHNYKSDDYLSGTQEAVLWKGITANAMYIDKRIEYTGSWMTRFFGEVKEQRDTTHFLLAENQIREFGWNKGVILVYPFDKIDKIEWLTEQKAFMESADEIIKARYQVAEPVLEIKVSADREKVMGYDCIRFSAELRTETKDIKKKSSSITDIRQESWISDAVPGFDQYKDFQKKLSEKLGLEAERLGNLNFILRYWDGPLDAVLGPLQDIEGYPVQTVVTVTATYIKNTDSPSPEKITKEIKTETMTLREVQMPEQLDLSQFTENIPMKTVTVE